MFDSIERIAKFVQNLVIILGVVGGAITLLHSQYDRRVDRTIAFSKEFNSSVRRSYLNLMTSWNAYAEQNSFYRHSEDEQRKLINDFFKNDPAKDDDKRREASFNDTLDFYDTLDICVSRRSCDRNSALDFFRPSITALYQVFAFHIFDRRNTEKDPSVGRGLEDLYRMKADSWWQMYLFI